MTTTSQTIGVMPSASARTTTGSKSGLLAALFTRFVKAREAEANRRVAQFLSNQSADRLADLGFSAREIAEIRASGRIPVSYFE